MRTKVTWIVVSLLLVCLHADAQTAGRTHIKLIRDAAVSPDGSQIAFSWRSDIWIANIGGGAARRLTFNPASDTNPSFSPDGAQIAFESTRTGATQIFTMRASGGAPKQVTLNTNGYTLLEWTPDGKGFLISATRDHFWRRAQRLWIQSLDGTKAPKLLFDDYGASATLSADGGKLLYTREGTGTYRKRYYGSQESQVWEFDRESGEHRQLQGQGQGGCRWPLWVSDSDYVYANQSTGAWNLFEGRLGTRPPRQLTKFENDGVLFPAISRDGKTVVFLRKSHLYVLDMKSGSSRHIDIYDEGDPTVDLVKRVTHTRASGAAFTGDTLETAFIAGGDLWVMDTVLREPVRVARTPGEESSPVFTPDHKTLLFISETDGITDIWAATRKDEKKGWWQNSEFVLKNVTNDAHTESGLRLWNEGKQVAFMRGTNLMSMDVAGGKAKLIIEAWSAPSYDFSPDGKWIVYSTQDENYNHDVWIKPVDGSREPFNVSCHPDNDRSPKWSADGKMIAFVGRRWGDESDVAYVYLSKEKDEETSRHRKLEKALEKMKARGKKKKGSGKKGGKKDEPAATKKPAPKKGLAGTWTGRVEGPESVVPGGGFGITFVLKVTDGKVSGTYTNQMGESGSMDGTFDAKTGALILETDSDNAVIIARGTLKGDRLTGTWEMVEMGIGGTWFADREGGGPVAAGKPADAQKSGDKAKKKDAKKEKVVVEIDFEGLRDRIKRIRNPNSSEGGLLWALEGQKLYFRGSVGGKSGYYAVEFPDKTTPKFWTSSIGRGARWIDKKTLATLERGLPATVSSSGKATTYSFSINDEQDIARHHQAIFDAAWRIMRDRFYDERLGNNDWNAIREKYRGLAASVDASVLRTVANMMMGELNASHLGFSMFGSRRRPGRPGRGAPPAAAGASWRPTTGHLGTRFDPEWKGPGLKVKDVVSKTPAHREDSRIEVGEVILSIDGKAVGPEIEIATALTGPSSRDVVVRVKGADGKERDVTMRPTSYGAVRSRLYDDWMESNREKVSKLSGGKLGYLHIRGMGQGNLLTFDAELYRIGHGKDGLMIDVRENGGGSITDHLLTCLCQPTHAITRTRTSGEGYPHDRRVYASWDKPIIVLCNQNSFSNAEIFSHAVKTLKRGKVVGVPTAGGVISTGGASIMGVARVRLPTRGWYLLDGNDMELNGCVPHHTIWPKPGEMPAGIDKQLEKAVSVLMDDVKEWKARPRVKLKKASER